MPRPRSPPSPRPGVPAEPDRALPAIARTAGECHARRAYIRERAEEGEVQFVVISLKDNFYEKAHGLVGIHRDRRLECSRTLTLDLTRAQGV